MRCSHWSRNAIGIAIAFSLSFPAYGQDKEVESRAALALAKAKREREQTKAKAEAVAVACHTDYATAAKEAEKTKKPLALWVGVKCADYPSLRKALSEAVHCHMEAQRGDDTPRIVIQGGDGIEYYIRAEKIGDNTAAKIRKKWDAPYVPPVRGDVVISEEFSRLPFVTPATTAPVVAVNSTWYPVSTRTARTRIGVGTAVNLGGISAGACVGVG